MDPNESLHQIRQAVPTARASRSATIVSLAQAFDALDEWMSNDGFLPDDWRPRIGPPIKNEDGYVMDNVEHGKPGTYNAGCRCMRCRVANRERQADFRARRRHLEQA